MNQFQLSVSFHVHFIYFSFKFYNQGYKDNQLTLTEEKTFLLLLFPKAQDFVFKLLVFVTKIQKLPVYKKNCKSSHLRNFNQLIAAS